VDVKKISRYESIVAYGQDLNLKSARVNFDFFSVNTLQIF